MSSENSTPYFLQKKDLKKYMVHTIQKQEQTKEVKATMKKASEEIPEFTNDEVQTPINKLKKGKASDNSGIRAEDIKTYDDTTKEMNELIKQDDCTPETWRRIRLKVIHRKGNVEDVGNFRTICTLPALYKLFSTILYKQTLSQTWPDPGGFRRSYQTLDDLATYRLIEQKCQECSVNMWIVTIDFMKAFDAIKPQLNMERTRTMWNLSQSPSVSFGDYTQNKKKATVLTDKERYVRD